MVALYVTFAVVVFAVLFEWLHWMRCRRLSRLAFGPRGRAAFWTPVAPVLRVAALAALSWGLITLLLIDPKIHKQNVIDEDEFKHLVLVLDVSPSMHLKDSGLDMKSSRRKRASEVLESVFNRLPMREFRISVVAVFTEAKPVLIDSTDLEVVRHIMERLPMNYAFKPGKTNLFSGLEQAAKIAKPWNPKSTTVVMMTDGDSVPAKGMPRMPASVSNILVVGIGDPHAGRFIDGHQSRQNIATLRQVANRLDGYYHNANQKHIPSQLVSLLTKSNAKNEFDELGMREYALLAVTAGSTILAFLPLLLHLFGTSWRPGVASTRAWSGAVPGRVPVEVPQGNLS